MKLNKIINGMEKAAEAIDQNFEALNYENSGWVTVPLKNGSRGDARLMKIHRVVYIDATVTAASSGAGTGNANSIMQLPEGYRPVRDISLVIGTNAINGTAVIRISSSTGEVVIWSSTHIQANHTLTFNFIARDV
ncbi:hypothetical protein [Isobaculum melis]|uniref:Uncharacterized protein n=1 Tax=Isobaculum melis TaxID=142588 RepID=A0A1H9TGH6_9LACT|nr:hypothetical protein [Isobaculum melis]SER96440.1 hypothetical protein SAMN04488559_11363 [Isobaculum melis]